MNHDQENKQLEPMAPNDASASSAVADASVIMQGEEDQIGTQPAPPCAACGQDCPNAPDAASESSQAPEAPPVEVIGVRFRKNGKVYYFAPNKMQFEKDEGAIVDTARGIEYSTVAIANRKVSAKEIVAPLRPVVRHATKDDEARHRQNLEKENEAYNVCLEKIEEMRLEMKLVDVEYTFDNSKLLFYFTADGRIDFRDLVKHLASVFRTRIELRQIGIRDEAKMRGGLGICGRPVCCNTFLSDFAQVSIKMAKEQNLSLNSSKISGTCGRLMCCLRYEYDTYVEEIAKTPKVDSVVETPDGDGFVVETNPLVGQCRVKLLSAPDAAPKAYKREDLTFKGIFRKDLPTPPRPAKDDKNDKSDSSDHAKRVQRKGKRPAPTSPVAAATASQSGDKPKQSE